MIIGIKAIVLRGYTGADSCITHASERAATNAVAGRSFQTLENALEAASTAYREESIEACEYARIRIVARVDGELVDF